MIKPIHIGQRFVGPAYPCYIIAEAGVNHNGDIELAHQLIDAAAKSGADGIKFQIFNTESLITEKATKATYQVKATGTGGSQYEMLKALELTGEQHSQLQKHCEEVDITYLCTPYDEASVSTLIDMNVAALKLASTDTDNIPFLRCVAQTGSPVILSTGMSDLGEVENSVKAMRCENDQLPLILLHCTSEYPAPVAESNLRAIQTLEQAFKCPVGFSDHTSGIEVSTWAVAIGACLVEKHFTLDRNLQGPDHQASLEPHELSALVKSIRDFEKALGDGIKRPMPSEIPNKPIMRKSLVAKRYIKAGEIIKATDLTCKRPRNGLEPVWFDQVIGKTALIDITENSVLTMGSINWAG